MDAQVTPQFLQILHQFNCSRFLYQTDTTELVQAVDGGLGRNLKVEVGKELQSWLEVDANFERWEGGSLSAMEKRILITTFVGNAWTKLFYEPRYHNDGYFERTGNLLTLDGSEDAKVKIQGLLNYVPTPPPPADCDVAGIVLPGDDGVESSEPEIIEDSPDLIGEAMEVEGFLRTDLPNIPQEQYEEVVMLEM